MDINIRDIIKSGQLLNYYTEDDYYVIPYRNQVYKIRKSPDGELKTLFNGEFNNNIILKYRELYDYVDLSRDIRTLSISIEEHIINAFSIYDSRYEDAKLRIDLINSLFGKCILDDYYYISDYSNIDLNMLEYCNFRYLIDCLKKVFYDLKYGISYKEYKSEFSFLPPFIFNYLGVYALNLNECFIITPEIKKVIFKVYGINITKENIFNTFIKEKFGKDASTVSKYLFDCTRGGNCGR